MLDMSPTASRNARIDTANGQFKEGMAQLAKMSLTPEGRKQLEGEIYTTHKNALGKIKAETTREWVDMFDDLADTFGGKLGGVLGKFADGFEKIAEMMSGDLTGPAGMFAKLFKREGAYKDSASEFSLPKIGEAIKSPLSSLSKGFGDFKSMFSTDLATGLTKGLTKMQAGAQVGGMVAGVGDLLGLGKGFSKGASIGGTVGGLFGPIGSIVGSLGGGLLGSLFSKAPKGKAILTGAGESAISGNKASARTALTGTAASIQDGLASLASQIGGTVGAFNVSVGKYKDSFRVSSTGATNVDTKKSKKISGLVYEGKDEAAAIAAAIKDAIADGAITGLAPIVQKALAGLGADSAIQFAKDWKSAMDDYKSMTDPVGAAIDSIVTPLNGLRETMLKVGASTEDLTKIDEYRTLKLKNALKEQLSSLTDFLAALKGEGSGVTQMDQLNAKMAEFDTYKARIASGDSSVDQSAFTQLGQSIFSLAGDIYGTATGQFQAIRSMLTGTTQALADNVTKAFNTSAGFDVTKAAADTTTAAIQAQAASAAAHYQAQANSNAVQESWLKQIAQGIAKLGNNGTVAANGDLAYNGQYMGKTY
ncbi:hypothetical protein NHF48_019660 [Sphingomonas sp. H160509]|uniref:hypothetical protein n=1 Tax=Sphingomonas sp. H160509 TaxID=2955313 RepID=UPI0021E9311A|nr:hypothetical protein [Sphingomonas sp. H160509]MDD1452635.1 hypothetical protein [Sphingomonas sp. H160509]